MEWGGEFFIGDTWMVYRGLAADNRPHAHATLQLTVSAHGPITISDGNGRSVSDRALCVRAGQKHKLQPARKVVLILIEPQSDLARFVLDHAENESVAKVDKDLISLLNLESEIQSIVSPLLKHAASSKRDPVDSRLEVALEYLKSAELYGAISKAAAFSGLSQPRLRAIAKAQMGVPLSKWLTWQAARRASQALAGGASLADAAFAGGFADQAHYTRTMGRLMGITPKQALKATSG